MERREAGHILKGEAGFLGLQRQLGSVSPTQLECPLSLPLEPLKRCHWESEGSQTPKCLLIWLFSPALFPCIGEVFGSGGAVCTMLEKDLGKRGGVKTRSAELGFSGQGEQAGLSSVFCCPGYLPWGIPGYSSDSRSGKLSQSTG